MGPAETAPQGHGCGLPAKDRRVSRETPPGRPRAWSKVLLERGRPALSGVAGLCQITGALWGEAEAIKPAQDSRFS
ncbi:MAG: hypothetical protein AAF636_25455 [Pseudomonadota bacterium]